MTIASSGNVGIGDSAPGFKLAVAGTASISGAVFMPGLSATGVTDNFVCRNPTTGELTFGVTCTASSERFKTNIEDLNHGLDWVSELRPVTFDWKHNGEPSLGFIAEEVASLSPLLAHYQDGEVYSVNYQLMTAVLARAVQELDGKIEDLGSQGSFSFDAPSLTEELFAAIIAKFKEVLGIEFGEGRIQTEEVEAQQLKGEQLCVGSVCITEEQFIEVFGTQSGNPEPTEEPAEELLEESDDEPVEDVIEPPTEEPAAEEQPAEQTDEEPVESSDVSSE